MVTMVPKSVQGFLVTIGKHGNNGTIDKFANVTVDSTQNARIVDNFYKRKSYRL